MNKYEINSLTWDSNFFGANTVKVSIYDKLTENDLKEILEEVKRFEFIIFSDRSSEYYNDYLIGSYTDAYLVDSNIQLSLINDLEEKIDESEKLEISNNYPYNEDILLIAKNNIKYSKYFNDPNVNSIKGAELYMNWTKNSFHDLDKYFITYKEETIRGFLLFSLAEEVATIELLIIDEKQHGLGIGTKLINELKHYLPRNFIINVGTQIDNMEAINFYMKNGFKLKTNQRTYHYWNEI